MSDIQITMGNKQGWECPKCGRVYAPWVSTCFYCGDNFRSVTQTSVTQTTAKSLADLQDWNANKEVEHE